MTGFFAGVGGWLSAHFLGLSAAAIGLAATLPLVVVLYFLKLKRKEQVVSSTLLWRRALEDLRVNAPFQRLKTSLLLLLQLLILLALALALSRPFAPGASGGRKASLVLLIDHSASMTTADYGGRSRLEVAKSVALDMVRNMPGESRAAVIAFAASPRVLTGFTFAKSALETAIGRIEPEGSGTDLESALQVADGLAGAVGRDGCRLIVMSDAALPASRPVRPISATVELRKFGGEAANLAVTSLEVARVSEAPSQVFARIGNFGKAPAMATVRLYVADRREAAYSRLVEIAPGEQRTEQFQVLAPAPATPVRVEIAPSKPGADAMAIDDAAWAVLPPDRELRLLAYTEDRNFLEKALAGIPGCKAERLSPSALAGDGAATPAAWAGRDVIVFDGCAPKALPPGRGYFFINACPPLESASFGEAVKAPRSVDWDRGHILTRFASLEGIGVVRARPVKLAPDQTVLLESEAGPLLAAWKHEQLRVLAVGFDLYESNWPLRVSFPVFMANAVRWLAEAGPASTLWAGGARRCGEPLRLSAAAWSGPEASAGSEPVEVRLERPDGAKEILSVPADAPRLYSATGRPGLYRAVGPGGREMTFACSVLDEAESANSARDAINFSVKDAPGWSREVASAAPDNSPAGREYWKYAAMLALAVFLIEWVVYNRRLWG